jgi:hypothetical protein
MLWWFTCNIPNSDVSEYLTTNTSNSSVGKYYVAKKKTIITKYNKINLNKHFFIFLCMHIFFTCFLLFFFWVELSSYGLGWAGLDWTQPAQGQWPGGFYPPEFTDAGYSHHVIKFLMHSVGELFCKTGDTYLGAGWGRWRAVPPFVSSDFFLFFCFLSV